GWRGSTRAARWSSRRTAPRSRTCWRTGGSATRSGAPTSRRTCAPAARRSTPGSRSRATSPGRSWTTSSGRGATASASGSYGWTTRRWSGCPRTARPGTPRSSGRIGTMNRPTLEAVAARAGVGRGTVSRVINGSPNVSQKAREAVQAAIQELGYVPNRAARTLVTRRTDTVALVVSESEGRLFDEPYFAGTIRGIGSALSETGLQLL